jgi:hypothetical protein
MKTIEKKLVVATIYNKPLMSKAEARAESEKAMKAFLRTGGSVVVEKPKRMKKSTMAAKSSKGFVAGTSGFATGYPRRSFGA